MTETLFVFDERNYQNCQSAYRGAGNQEYYLGDYSIEAGSVIDVRAEKKAVGACSIIVLKSKTRLFFRRTWYHIREDGTDVAVLWFVKRGRLCVTHQSGQSIAKAGDFVITKSTTPFFIECQTDEDSLHEVLHVLMPSHVLRRFITRDVRTGFLLPAIGREFHIAEHILTQIFEDTGELAEPTAQMLVDSALAVLGDAIRQRDACSPVRQSVSDKRLQDVLRFIEVHLSDSKLSIATVAKGCGISPRYLSFLLKLHGSPFSTLVWQKRLKTASGWLSQSKPNEISISEIAYRVGFKSPAHFSRMFKRVYGMSPCDYRSASLSSAPRAPQPVFSGTANSLQ